MMNKKFIATFAAAAMLCCVCHAGVAVADDNTDFNATITQLISQADNHIDALKKLIDNSDNAKLKSDPFNIHLDTYKPFYKNLIDTDKTMIEQFEQHLNAAGEKPNQNTLDALRAEAKELDKRLNRPTNNSFGARAGFHNHYDVFRGYSTYSSWRKASVPYNKLEDTKSKLAKLTALDKQFNDLRQAIQLPSEVHPISIEDQSNYDLDQVKVKYWYDGEPNADNSAYVKAQLAFWHKLVEKSKRNLEDKVANGIRDLVARTGIDVNVNVFDLNREVNATVNVHNGDEYLSKELAQQGTLKKAFDHTIIHYGNGVSLPPRENPDFDYEKYNILQQQIDAISSNINDPLKKFGWEFTYKDPSQLTAEQRKEYCDAYEKYTASRIENSKKLEDLRKEQAELGDKNAYKAYDIAEDLSTARDGAVSYAYLHLKFKKYVQDQLNNGKNLEQLLEDDAPAYNKAKKLVDKISYSEAGTSKEYRDAIETVYRYEFMVDLLAARDNDAYIKEALKNGISYDDMLKATVNDRLERDKKYNDYANQGEAKVLYDRMWAASTKWGELNSSGASKEEIKQAEADYYKADDELYKYIGKERQRFDNKQTELYAREDLIKKLKSGEYDTTVLDIDNLALTPEQKSSEDVAPLDYNDSSFENPDGDTGNKPDNNPDGDSGNNPDNNPAGPFDDFNFDDIDWGDFNFDDLDLDDLGLDDVEAEDFDFSEFDTYASEISDDDLASLDIDDINFDDLGLGDLDLGDLDLGDFYNDDTQSGDTNSGETAKPGNAKPGDTTNSGDTNAGNTAKPGETKPEDVAKPGDTTNSGDTAKSGETTKPGDAKSSETIKPGDAKSVAAKIEAVKAEVAVDKTEDVKIEAAKSEFADAKSEAVKIEAAEADNDNAGDATQTDNVTKTQENNN